MAEKTWKIKYKDNSVVDVRVKEVFAADHDLKLTFPDEKIFLFKYETREFHGMAKTGYWSKGILISNLVPKTVLIAFR